MVSSVSAKMACPAHVQQAAKGVANNAFQSAADNQNKPGSKPAGQYAAGNAGNANNVSVILPQQQAPGENARPLGNGKGPGGCGGPPGQVTGQGDNGPPGKAVGYGGNAPGQTGGGYGGNSTAPAPVGNGGNVQGGGNPAAPGAPGNPNAPGGVQNSNAVGPEIDRNIDFTKLSTQERSELGLNDRDRAILHLWGRQVISRGFNDGGIYSNVLDTEPQKFTQAERQLVTELRAREQAQYGGDTGKALDQEFFTLMQRMNPDEPIDASRWMNSPVRRSQGPVDITSDVNTLAQRTGLTGFDQAVLRLWGHEPLFNGGKIDGSILGYTLGNANALDNPAKGGAGSGIDQYARALLQADLASDGVRNGDSLKGAFADVLDKIYLGGPGASMEKTVQRASETAAANGRTMGQIVQDVQRGMTQALSDAAGMMRDHPIITTVGVGGMAAAAAVCPFLGGVGIGAAGIAAGQAMMNRNARPAA